MTHDCIAAHREAKAAGRETYQGKPCRHGHNGERYTSNKMCVTCRAEGRPLPWRPNPDGRPEGPLARAQAAWLALQQQHPQRRPPHKLWGWFLDTLKDDDPEAYRAALSNMDRPQPPKPKQQRGFHDALAAWAEKHGVHEIERRVREAVLAGHYGSASKLRHQALDLMRRGAAEVNRLLAVGSSLASS